VVRATPPEDSSRPFLCLGFPFCCESQVAGRFVLLVHGANLGGGGAGFGECGRCLRRARFGVATWRPAVTAQLTGRARSRPRCPRGRGGGALALTAYLPPSIVASLQVEHLHTSHRYHSSRWEDYDTTGHLTVDRALVGLVAIPTRTRRWRLITQLLLCRLTSKMPTADLISVWGQAASGYVSEAPISAHYLLQTEPPGTSIQKNLL
jgi:hypothetical protein